MKSRVNTMFSKNDIYLIYICQKVIPKKRSKHDISHAIIGTPKTYIIINIDYNNIANTL